MQVCEFCSGPMPEYSFGRPRRFCSWSCSEEFHTLERQQALALFRASGRRVQRPDVEGQEQHEDERQRVA
jgi:hypothetical protein